MGGLVVKGSVEACCEGRMWMGMGGPIVKGGCEGEWEGLL